MKINVFLKVTLFAFLCSILSVVAYIITNIEIIALITNWFWFVAYFGLVAWICSKIYKKIRYSVNLIFVVGSFGIALYSGFWIGIRDEFNTINTFGEMSLTAVAFVVFSLVCLMSAIVLIGRLIFGTPAEKVDNVIAVKDAAVIEESFDNNWVCECGTQNSGKFCAECGRAKTEHTADIEESDS